MQDPNTMSREDLVHEVLSARERERHVQEALDDLGLPREIDGSKLTPYGRFDQLKKALVEESPVRAITLDVRLGIHVNAVCAYALALAKVTKTDVKFKFNDKVLTATEYVGGVQDLIDRYWAKPEGK